MCLDHELFGNQILPFIWTGVDFINQFTPYAWNLRSAPIFSPNLASYFFSLRPTFCIFSQIWMRFALYALRLTQCAQLLWNLPRYYLKTGKKISFQDISNNKSPFLNHSWHTFSQKQTSLFLMYTYFGGSVFGSPLYHVSRNALLIQTQIGAKKSTVKNFSTYHY
jgi:hypothetical protein